jgi:hypothetical protein
MGRLILLICICAGVGGCVERPTAIHAWRIPETEYMSWTCEDLAGRQDQVAAGLTDACEYQRSTRVADVCFIVIFGFPAAPYLGDRAEKIGALKGELAAVRYAAMRKGCELPQILDPVTGEEMPSLPRDPKTIQPSEF